MIKHRLMLSAAAAALSAAGLLSAATTPARADTDITTTTGKALTTGTDGNITIESGGGITAKIASPLITLNSNHFVVNGGILNNDGISAATGVSIDTTVADLVPAGAGFSSNGSISLQGTGTGKTGILISGGNTFYGPISLTPSVQTVVGGAVASTQASQLSLKGDNSTALYLVQGTSVTSNILLGGSISQTPSAKSTSSGGTIIDLDGTVNGNVANLATITGIGANIRGIYTAGGIHSCAADTGAPSGFTCPTNSEGALINAGSVSLNGPLIRKTRGVNVESGSAMVIAGSVDGGIVNGGPATASSVSAATLLANGTLAAPTVLIDPYQSVNSVQTTPRGPVIIGPVAATVDATNPGYSFINRGNIQAAPVDPQVSSMAMAIRGNSAVNYTCLSAVVGSCSAVDGAGNPGGGLLNTGTISAVSSTNEAQISSTQITGLNQYVTATGLDIGGFATVPRIDVISQAVDSTTFTPATIKGEVTGLGQGSAYGIFIEDGANVATINIGRNASVLAGVTTVTTSPTKDIAQAGAPFSLVSEAIVDRSNSLSSIINAGVIQAVNTPLTPGPDAVVSNVQRAIDLQNSTHAATVQNSGVILGDVMFGSAGNGNVLNVGNVDGGTTNNATGIANNPSNWAVVAMTNTAQANGGTWDPLESTCRHASLSIL